MNEEEKDSMIKATLEELNKKDKLIERLSKAIICLGLNENLTVEKVIDVFSDDKRTEVFDDFMERWQNTQLVESRLKYEVINLILEDYLYDYLWGERSDNPCDFFEEIERKECKKPYKYDCIECLKQYYFKKAGEEL